MDGDMYIDILERTLIPFINKVYPNGHRFVQDNDPKHKYKKAMDFIEDKNINWFHTPAESPNLNPIKNLWREMKEFIRREVKPHSKEELVQGIQQVWSTVSSENVGNT